jgi:invasion protein IalB
VVVEAVLVNIVKSFAFAVGLLALTAIPAAAQTDATAAAAAPAQNAAQAAQPRQQLVANESQHVGDWLVRCFPVKGPAPCDMIYILAIKKTNQMLLTVRFAYVPAQDKNLFQIGVPLGVSFPKGLVITSDAGTSAPLRFVHCDRNGCFVESIMDDGSLDALANAQGGAKIHFFGFTGKAVVLPFPSNGFAKARETMVQLAKSHGQAAAAKSPEK